MQFVTVFLGFIQINVVCHGFTAANPVKAYISRLLVYEFVVPSIHEL